MENEKKKKRNSRVVQLLVDVWWHLPSTNRDCAGGHDTGSYPLLAVSPVFLRHLPKTQPDADADGFIFLFLGKCSSVGYHGRPVQVCVPYFRSKAEYRFFSSRSRAVVIRTVWMAAPIRLEFEPFGPARASRRFDSFTSASYCFKRRCAYVRFREWF